MAKFTTINQNLALSPFGMVMPGRNWKAGTASGYGFGFNGKLKDDEIKGNSNSYDFGARIYDARLGRFLSVDPRTAKYPSWTPYLFAANSPLRFIDIDGKGPGDVVTVSANYQTLIEVVNKFDVEMTNEFNNAKGGTVSKNPSTNKIEKKGFKETGFQIVGKSVSESRITRTGISYDSDGTVLADKPTDLKVGEQVIADFHSHPQSTGSLAYEPNSN